MYYSQMSSISRGLYSETHVLAGKSCGRDPVTNSQDKRERKISSRTLEMSTAAKQSADDVVAIESKGI